MSTPTLEEILKLSVSERIQLVEDIWDSIVFSPESLPLTDAQKAELGRRLADYRANPSAGRTWEEVRESLEDDK
jgi:putative addiction module component (TIGR02574 family)